MSEASKAIQIKVWSEFTSALKKANSKWSPVPNAILDSRVANVALPLEQRFDALLDRRSMGNWSLFSCQRDWDTGVTVADRQADYAKILGVDKRRISEVVRLRQKQGLVHSRTDLTLGHLLMPVLDRTVNRPVEESAEEGPTWKDFSERWDAEHADDLQRKAEALAAAAPYQKIAAQVNRAKLVTGKK